MILGFTGTRKGMTRVQKALFEGVVARLCPREFHHGDCVGADADAHEIVRRLAPTCLIILHPPDIDAERAFCAADRSRPPKPYRDRNRMIVASCDEIAAAPRTMAEQLRGSGTWMTIRYARKAGKPLHMLIP